jgi:hypothetical protein
VCKASIGSVALPLDRERERERERGRRESPGGIDNRVGFCVLESPFGRARGCAFSRPSFSFFHPSLVFALLLSPPRLKYLG